MLTCKSNFKLAHMLGLGEGGQNDLRRPTRTAGGPVVSRHGLEPCERGGHCAGGRACEWAQPRWGWVSLGTVTQGSSQTRNPGLEGAAPLGLGDSWSMNEPTQFLLYTAPDGAVKVDVFLKNETVWLTQKALAELFGVKVPAINKHLGNIFESGELTRAATISKMEIVRAKRTRKVSPEGDWRKEWHNPVGVGGNWARLPRVVATLQPRAGGRSPVGAGMRGCGLSDRLEASENSVCSILETTAGDGVNGQFSEFSGTNATKTHRFSL